MATGPAGRVYGGDHRMTSRRLVYGVYNRPRGIGGSASAPASASHQLVKCLVARCAARHIVRGSRGAGLIDAARGTFFSGPVETSLHGTARRAPTDVQRPHAVLDYLPRGAKDLGGSDFLYTHPQSLSPPPRKLYMF